MAGLAARPAVIRSQSVRSLFAIPALDTCTLAFNSLDMLGRWTISLAVR